MIDAHAHLGSSQFDEDRAEVIKRAQAAGVGAWIEIGADMSSSRQAAQMVHQYQQAWATVGVHPDDIEELSETNWEELAELARDEKVVGIGEVGFDYFRGGKRSVQEPVLRRFLELAVQVHKPVVLHMRSSETQDANADMIALWLSLPESARPQAILHSYSGSLMQAKQLVKLGFYLGISGIVTFKNAGELLQVGREIALDHLLIETDSPFLAPHPYRGQRNEPAYVRLVAEKIADLKGIDFVEVVSATEANTEKVFGIKIEHD